MILSRPGLPVRALWYPRSDRVLVQWGYEKPLLLDPAAGEPLWTGKSPFDLAKVALAPGGQFFAHATTSTLQVVRVTDGQPGPSVRVDSALEGLGYSPDGLRLAWSHYATSYDYGAVYCWSLADADDETVDKETGHTTALGFSSDSSRILIGYGDGVAVHSAARPFARTGLHEVDLYVDRLTPQSGGPGVFATSSHGEVALLDLLTGKVSWSVKPAPVSWTVLIHPRGDLVAWIPRFPESHKPVPLPYRRVGEARDRLLLPPASGAWLGAAWLHGGEQIALHTEQEVCVYDLSGEAPQLRDSWGASGGPLTAMALSPEDRIVCGTRGGEVGLLEP